LHTVTFGFAFIAMKGIFKIFTFAYEGQFFFPSPDEGHSQASAHLASLAFINGVLCLNNFTILREKNIFSIFYDFKILM
jgi:hypothetical protein